MTTVEGNVRIQARLSGDVTAETLRWTDLREFMDALLGALIAMPGGLRRDALVLRGVESGSAVPTFTIPRAARGCVSALVAGPQRSWSHQQRRAVEPLYGFARQHQLRVELGSRRLAEVVIPPQGAGTYRSLAEVAGIVRTVGFKDGNILHLQVRDEGSISCRASRALVKEMAAHLGDEVAVTGEVVRDVLTGAVLSMTIESFRSVPPRAEPDAALAELRRLNGGRVVDIAAFLRERRGA